MSGIVCQSSTIDLERLDFIEKVGRTFLGRQLHKETLSKKNLNASIVSTPNSSASQAHDDKTGVTILVDGYFVEALGSEQSSAQWFLNIFLELGLDCLGTLNGSFNILILEKNSQQIMLVTDRYGTRPLFYKSSPESFTVAYRSEILVNLGVVPKALNQNMVANTLSHSRIWFGEESFYEGVTSVPAGIIAKWSPYSELELKKYQIKTLYENQKPTIEGLAEVFRDVIKDFSKVPNIGLSLSGGLDSRILLASGFSGPTFTWGYQEGNDEISLAKKCADMSSNPWYFIKLDPSVFLDHSGRGDIVREGLDLFVQSYALDCYPHVAESGVDGLITGLALDFTMAGSYTPTTEDEMTLGECIDFAFSKIEYFKEEERSNLIHSEEVKKKIESINSKIIEQITENYIKTNGVEALQIFFTEHRIRRYIFQRQMWQRTYCEDYIPTFDNRIVDYLANFSLEERANHNIFREVLLKLSEDLALIPYQGTNIPPSAPLKFWRHAENIEAEKEELARNIFYETNGKVFVPYNRYYSNFDEWLRTNADWKSTVRNLLLSKTSRLNEYLNRDAVEKMIVEQELGKKTHHGKIVVLMSLEKTLRTFH
ncbi:hypothetical protein TUM3794_28910 [Shewanella colwelliana]|uniref:asparagine synthase (glutamine-hydrolyzing) n=1 Tax=Shewanella colwelliana TaxID=23 RepID=A0ABQ4P779_SHECO|nr:hypothetical protein [Shewanella colwelliana]GIU43389.1 hypothetical protein TUM3794_28910 [Shewanella colwelliana]